MISKTQKDRLTDLITLMSIPGVGRSRYRRLIKACGSVQDVLSAPVSKLEAIPDIGKKVACAIKSEVDRDAAMRSVERIEELGWQVLFPGDESYPSMLREIPDSPVCLFARGQVVDPNEKMIAIVGTRNASEEGRAFTRTLAAEIARAGLTVVSGMAEGIDTAAHIGALEAGGRTVAVWGTSLEIVYPPINRVLADRIGEQGIIFSEYFPEQGPDRSTFPDRNRIISGLADGVVVVEAGQKSGALITAELALQQGRELFAVPGRPGSERSIGTNALLKRGARLITSIDDIFEELPRLKGEVSARRFKARPELTEMEQKMIDALTDGPLQVDKLSRSLKTPVAELMEFLLALEMKGMVQELSGKRYVLSE